MANSLSPAEWKKILKDHKDAPDTGPFTKAIESYAKVEPKAKDDPQPVLDALEKVVDAAKDAKSANFKDKKRKPLVDFLDDVLKDAATMKVKAERFLQEKAERDREGPDEDEGGDNERAKLTERLFKVKKLNADTAKPFVLALGSKVHGLVIAKTGAITNDHKKRARKMREGNGRLFLGLVFGEKGKYVFQMEVKPPGGIAKALKKTALKHTDLPPIRVIVRGPENFELDDENDIEEMADLGIDSEEAGDDASTPSNGPQTAPGGKEPEESAKGAKTANAEEKERFSAKVKELTPRIKQALTDRGPLAGEIDRLRGEMWDLGTKAQFTRALEVLARLEPLLAQASATKGESPGAETSQRITALSPQVKALLQAKAPAAKETGLKFSEAQTFARKGEFDRANALLDEVENLVGANSPAQTNGKNAEPPVEARSAEARKVEAELERLRPLTLKCIREGAGDVSKMRALLAYATEKLETDAEVPQAKKALEGLETLVKAASASAEKRKTENARDYARGRGELVSYRQARDSWKKASDSLRSSITQLKTRVLKEYPQANLAPLENILDKDLGTDLATTLEKAEKTTDDRQRALLHAAAIGLIREYRADVLANPEIRHLDQNPWIEIHAVDELVEALDAMRSVLTS